MKAAILGISNVILGKAGFMELQGCIIAGEDPVCYYKVKMGMHIESFAKMLDEADGSDVRIWRIRTASGKSFPDLIDHYPENILSK